VVGTFKNKSIENLVTTWMLYIGTTTIICVFVEPTHLEYIRDNNYNFCIGTTHI